METADAARNLINIPYMFGDGCTYFLSQSLRIGGMPGDADWTPTSSDQSKLATHSPAYNPGSTKDPAEADYFNYMVHSVKATMHKSSWGIKTAGGTQLETE